MHDLIHSKEVTLNSTIDHSDAKFAKLDQLNKTENGTPAKAKLDSNKQLFSMEIF